MDLMLLFLRISELLPCALLSLEGNDSMGGSKKWDKIKGEQIGNFLLTEGKSK